MIDTCIPVLEVIYFWKVSREWVWFSIVFGQAIGIIVIAGTFFLPESPKYLITMKRYDQAREAVNFFNTLNEKPFRGKFDCEIKDHKN